MSMNLNPFSRFRLEGDTRHLIAREPIISEVAQKITSIYQPESVVLTGLTGVGKTAILRAVCSEPSVIFDKMYHGVIGVPFRKRQEQIRFLYISFAIVKYQPINASVLYRALIDGLAILQKEQYCNINIGLYDVSTCGDAEDIWEELLSSFREAKSQNHRLVIGLDDFDNLLLDADFDVNYIGRLRHLVGTVSFIVTSSITRKELKERRPTLLPSPFLNVLIDTLIGLFTPEEAQRFVQSVLAWGKTELPAKAVEFIVEQGGYHPFLTLLVGEQLYNQYQAWGEAALKQRQLDLIVQSSVDVAWGALDALMKQFSLNQRSILERIAQGVIPTSSHDLDLLMVRGIVRARGQQLYLFSPLFALYLSQRQPSETIATVSTEQFTPTERALFEFLSERPQQLCTYEVVKAHIWGDTRPKRENDALNSLVSRLRKKLDDANLGELQTRRNQGYMFIPK